jgi:hypothetical protein
MQLVGHREVVERNGRPRGRFLARLDLVGGNEEIVEQRREIPLGSGADVSLPISSSSA